MEAELKNKFDVDVKLIPSSGGVFEVTVDDKLVFSKRELGRFPEPGEVVTKVKEAN